MVLDLQDTIAAICTAAGPAARGIVRICGSRAIECLGKLVAPEDVALGWDDLRTPTVVCATWRGALVIPCDIFVWPTNRSFTRQPTIEIHTFGSNPILDSVLADVCAQGARLAEPGEFTLRAFLAGRIDLTQAEAVLGVIEARGQRDLDAALVQLAGGLSRPLACLREELVAVLAELEAGLDFVDEHIEFISREELHRNLSRIRLTVAAIAEQMEARNTANGLPRVVLVGPPNTGKSSLFNAMATRWGITPQAAAIVSARPGTTRDYLAAQLDLDGMVCELIDTAGLDIAATAESVAGAAQGMTVVQRQQADLVIRCVSADTLAGADSADEEAISLLTKSDLSRDGKSRHGYIYCSSVTGEGLCDVGDAIRRRLAQASTSDVVTSTALRCGESLRAADASLASAFELVETGVGEELVAAEVRHALGELGRVVGAVYTDDLLDRIFSQFCIGK